MVKRSGENYPDEYQSLIGNELKAKVAWNYFILACEKIGRKDMLEHPIVLDIGGGAGYFSKYLNSKGIRCISIDRMIWDKNTEANQMRADAQELPVAENLFDVVHSRGVFDKCIYPNDNKDIFAEVSRVLKDNGVFIIFDADQPPEDRLTKYFTKIYSVEEGNYTIWEKK